MSPRVNRRREAYAVMSEKDMSASGHVRADTADIFFRLPGGHKFDLLVMGFEGTEGIGELFQFRVRLASTHGDLELDNFVGLPAVLEMEGQHGTRRIEGVIQRFEVIEEGSSLSYYEATLVPPHWLLTQHVQSRIFQKPRYERTSTKAIIAAVLKAAGFDEKSVRLEGLPETEREFTVQYRESHWDFICRLIEEEGWHFYFDPIESPCRMVVADGTATHALFAIAPDGDFISEVPYRDPNGLVAPGEFIHHVRVSREIRMGAVGLDDFNFRDPGGELRVEATRDKFTGLKFADYPGKYGDRKSGQRLAEIRLQEQQAGRSTALMSTNVRAFWPGGTFKLIEHPNGNLNKEYLVTQISHRALQTQSAEAEAGGEGSRYEAEIRVIPAEVTYRSPRVTPRPTVLGSQTAIVTGPKSEEVYTDAYGRVKVRFHWDQESDFDENASCWIRVSQGWAGGQYGMMFLPRVGQEVIVDFLEGDPDKPIITGRVYNNDHMPPYKLPDHKTISAIRTCSSPGGKGGNEIRFEDKKGGEQLLLFAQNSLHLRAGGNRYESVCGEAHRIIAGDSYDFVKKTKNEIVNLDVWETTKGDRYRLVKGKVREEVLGDQITTVNGEFNISNDKGGIFIDSNTSITLSVKGNFIKIDPSGVTIVGQMVNINSGGSKGMPSNCIVSETEEPLEAASTAFGHNVRYTAVPEQGSAAGPEGLPREDESDKKQEVSWIEIELVDEASQPCVGESYEIKTPDGKTIRGTLDRDGRAHVALADPGACEVTFPKLDAAAWEETA